MEWRRLALAGVLALAAAGVSHADVVEVTGWQVNVRQRPSRRAPVIVNLPRGERFELVGRVGAWYHVTLPATGQTGFVHSSLVRVIPGATLETLGAEPAPPRARPVPTSPPPPAAEPTAPAPVPPAPSAPAPAAAAPRPALAPSPAAPPPDVPPPLAEPETRRFDLGVQGGIRWLTAASQSAKALFDGETSDVELGGFVSYAVTRNVFLSATAQVFQKEGERVFLVDAEGPIVPLGHPLKLRLIPAHLVVGYRFHPWPSVVPYLAVGGGVTFYREESTVGGVTESASTTKGMGIAQAGVDFVTRGVLVGVQASWSTVPNAVGTSGVSEVYGENDLGGVSVSIRLGVTF